MNRINSLTGLRFIAAFMVLVSHSLGGLFPALNEMGGISVQVFFVLSGFVMYLSYADRINAKQIGFKRYFTLRFVRLYPLYMLSLIIGVAFLYFFKTLSLSTGRDFILFTTMSATWVPSMSVAFSPINPPAWSVGDEFFFYVCFYFLIRYLGIKKTFFLYVFSVIFFVILFILLKDNIKPSAFKWLWYINPFYRLLDFILGVLVGHIYAKTSFVNITFFRRYLGLFLVITLYATQFFLPMDTFWYIAILTGLISSWLIFSLASNQCVLSSFLSNPFILLLGEASYALYLIHWFLITYICPHIFHNIVLLTVLKLTLPVFVSVIIFKCYELPVSLYLKRRL